MFNSTTLSNHRALTLSIHLFLLFAFIAQVQARRRNITVSNASSQIVYTPFLCDSTVFNDTHPQCPGAWQLVDLDGTTFVSTNGPDPATGGTNPQLFLQFRASAMYFTTSPFSSATANITISANGTTVDATFDSSAGSVALVDLRESATTTVAITFFPDTPFSQLDIGNFTLTVTDNPASTVIFPSMTLPPTASLPTVLPPSSTSSPSPAPTPVQGVSNRTKIAEGVGIVVGLGLGLTALAVVGYIIWRRRRRRDPRDIESEASTVSSDRRRPQPPPPPLPRPKKKISEKIKAWF